MIKIVAVFWALLDPVLGTSVFHKGGWLRLPLWRCKHRALRLSGCAASPQASGIKLLGYVLGYWAFELLGYHHSGLRPRKNVNLNRTFLAFVGPFCWKYGWITGDVTKTPIRKTPSFRHKIIKVVFQVLYLCAFRLHGSAERGCEAHPRQTRGTPAMSNFWKM